MISEHCLLISKPVRIRTGFLHIHYDEIGPSFGGTAMMAITNAEHRRRQVSNDPITT